MPNHLHLVSGTKFENVKSIKDLPLNIPFIYREDGSATRKAMEEYIHKYGLSVRKKMILTSNEAVKQAVIANLGVSIVPLIGIRNELKNGQLHSLSLEGLPIVSEWDLVWIKGKRMFPAAQAFIDYVNENKAAIIDKHFSWTKDYMSK
jgi:DNA-binding transcriptional LysR family regulator